MEVKCLNTGKCTGGCQKGEMLMTPLKSCMKGRVVCVCHCDIVLLRQAAGADSGTAARKPAAAAAADTGKLKKLKGRVMEDPISDEDDMFAEKSAPRRVSKETEEFLLERNKKCVHLLTVSVCRAVLAMNFFLVLRIVISVLGHSLCLGYFVCVRLFSCIISAFMLYYRNTVR